FSPAKPWLPLSSDYMFKNVAAEEEADVTHLKVFRALVKLRKTPTLLRGDCEVTYSGNTLLVYRTLADNPSVITVVNLDNMEHVVNLQAIRPSLQVTAQLLIKSVNIPYSTTTIDVTKILLPPLSGVVLSTF
ncbi:hypothetical protein GE061_018388, partial [Apolygus lucorum]